jgi:hypothetical protein
MPSDGVALGEPLRHRSGRVHGLALVVDERDVLYGPRELLWRCDIRRLDVRGLLDRTARVYAELSDALYRRRWFCFFEH